MSERDPPGRDNRTVIRPNPGGRRPATPPAAAPPPPARTPSPFDPPAPPAQPVTVDWDQRTPTPQHWRQGAADPLGAPPTPSGSGLRGGGDPTQEWIDPSKPGTAPVRRAENLERFEDLFAPNADPLLRAVAPLLLLLGRLRASLLAARLASLLDQVAEAIKKFEADLRVASLPDEQIHMAKYVICATADDIIQNMPVDDRQSWPRYSMLASFFGERLGGVRFFDLVEKAKQDPVVNYAQLELQHACLALGFQGRYRSEGGGFAILQQIQRSIYETLRRVRPRVPRELSPHWKGQALAARRARLHVPVWGVSAVAALLLFGLYIVLRYLLSGGAEVAAAATLALDPPGQISIARKVFAPPPPPPAPTPTQLTQLQRIRAALAPEIKAGTISVPDPTGPNWIVINVGSLLLFQPGQAVVIDKFKPLGDRIRAMLEHETGTIGVIGHTDATRLTPTSPFKSNLDLSIARATNVVTILKEGFSNPGRFKTEGRGSDQPIGDNKTDEGRRQNRRVEILVQRTD